MADLVDYLRDKLEHANDVVCSCPDCDVSIPTDPTATVKGYDWWCPIHGEGGTDPLFKPRPAPADKAWLQPEYFAPVRRKRWWRR